MKNKIIFLLIFLIGSSLWFGCSSDKQEENVVKIGVILPLTGGGAEWGITSKNAIKMAYDEAKKKSNRVSVSLLYADSKTNAKDALNALNKFKAQGVKFIIGDIISSNVLAMAPIIEKNHMLLISPGASNPDISFAGDHIFRTWQSDAVEAKIGASFILDSLSWKNITLLYLENGYGTGLANEFQKYLKKNNVKISLIESFKVGQKDFRNIITKVLHSKIDGIYLASYPEENYVLLTQLEEQKNKLPALGTQGFVSPKIEKIFENLSFPACYTAPVPPDTNLQVVKNFKENYKKMFGKKPGLTADAAYDAFNLLYTAIEKYGGDVEKVKNFLYNVKNYSGASGILTFNKYGDVEKPFTFIKNKIWRLDYDK